MKHIKKLKGCQKNKPKKGLKLSPNNQKQFNPNLIPKTTCFLPKSTSIAISSSFQLWFTNHFKCLIPDFLSKPYVGCLKKLMGGSLDFESKLMSLCCHESQKQELPKIFLFFLNLHKISRKKLQESFFSLRSP